MKRIIVILTALLMVSLASAQEAAPIAVVTQNSGGVTLERYFGALTQGGVGVLRLSGENITGGRALFRSREYPLIAAESGWYVLLIADIDAQPREYPLAVLVTLADGSSATFDSLVSIETAEFIRANFQVAPNLGYLIEPEVERQEFARLDAIIAETTPERFWSEGWQLPIEAPYTSAFGQYRILNQSFQTRHTGWDQSAAVGTPVSAMAAGRIAFAGRLDIRGNYVMIDHGWGVYSGYAHLSQINVERGQTIAKGQIIGSSGNTGRSSGPHLHWEIAVNGEWVDGKLFMEMWLP